MKLLEFQRGVRKLESAVTVERLLIDDRWSGRAVSGCD